MLKDGCTGCGENQSQTSIRVRLRTPLRRRRQARSNCAHDRHLRLTGALRPAPCAPSNRVVWCHPLPPLVEQAHDCPKAARTGGPTVAVGRRAPPIASHMASVLSPVRVWPVCALSPALLVRAVALPSVAALLSIRSGERISNQPRSRPSARGRWATARGGNRRGRSNAPPPTLDRRDRAGGCWNPPQSPKKTTAEQTQEAIQNTSRWQLAVR
jgi:hypothetical protein